MLIILVILGVYCLGLVSGVVCICIVKAGAAAGDKKQHKVYRKTDIKDSQTGGGKKQW